MPSEVRFPIIDRRLFEQLVGRFEKLRLLNIHIRRREQVERLEIIAPIPIGRQVLELLRRHFVVILDRIAQLHASARGFRQFRFQRENLFGFIQRFRLWVPEQCQHFRNMLDILIAQFLRSSIGLGVVIAVREA